MTTGPTSRGGLRADAKDSEIQHVGKGINGPNGAAFIDVIVKVFRQQHRLLAI
jgi:hypothetical protein